MTEVLHTAAWQALTRDLCAYPCGANTPGNTEMFQRLCEELPFTLHEYPAGAEYNGWLVPERWHVEKAEVRKDGVLLFDGCCHPLAVAALSRSFKGRLSREDLEAHLVTNPQLPEAHTFHCQWQYRPWAADWALCVPWAQMQDWGPGWYDIELVTQHATKPMQMAEYTHHGESPKTFVFQAHTCHPCQAEDGFGAVALLVKLFQSLRGRKTRYTYTLLLGPEHLGTVFWLKDKSHDELELLCGGCFMEMPGVDAPLKAASSYLGEQCIDVAVRVAMQQQGATHVHVPWRCGAGNDETVWEAPGYEVPFVELTRCQNQFAPFPFYHSQLDAVDAMCVANVEETYRVLQSCLFVLEHDAVISRHFRGLICLSHPRYDLYMPRPDPAVDFQASAESERWGHLLDCLFRDLNGQTRLTDMAEKYALPFHALHAYLKQWEAKGLVSFAPAPVRRPSLFSSRDDLC